jgi:hypothetical protein
MKTLKNTLLALSLSLSFGIVACDGTGGDPAAEQPGLIDVGSPAQPADVTPFLGTWGYASGSVTTTCDPNPGTKEISAADGTVEVGAGSAPNTIAVRDSLCAFSATVSGTTAVAEPGTVCPSYVGTTSIAYTLSGGALHKQASAILGVAKFGVVCSKTEDAMLVRQ